MSNRRQSKVDKAIHRRNVRLQKQAEKQMRTKKFKAPPLPGSEEYSNRIAYGDVEQTWAQMANELARDAIQSRRTTEQDWTFLNMIMAQFDGTIHRGNIDSAIAKFKNNAWRNELLSKNQARTQAGCKKGHYWRKNATKDKQNKMKKKTMFFKRDIHRMKRRQRDPRWTSKSKMSVEQEMREFAKFIY